MANEPGWTHGFPRAVEGIGGSNIRVAVQNDSGRIEEVLGRIWAGRMVILVDDEDRENKGDLTLAAEHVTPEAINFMARYGRGLICLSRTEKKAKVLNLPLMV